jgi:hypothetical protein
VLLAGYTYRLTRRAAGRQQLLAAADISAPRRGPCTRMHMCTTLGQRLPEESKKWRIGIG